VASRAPLDVNGLAANGRAELRAVGLGESLGRVATLAAAALSAPSASIMSADARALPGISGAPGIGDQRSPFEQLLCAEVVGSQDKVIIGDTRLGRRRGNTDLSGPASVIAWAGVPVRDQDGHVAGVLWVADWKPRSWSTSDIAILEILAEVASSDVTLRAALARSAGRAALAQTLEESLLPPPLPGIPGLQLAAWYAAAGTGAEVLADFCDVFPSAGRTWGLVVGDVCGKGSAAAKATALARHTLRTTARRQTRPSLILAHLNQMLLDWPTDDPRFLTAIYAAVRPVRGGAAVRISSAGHPLALVRTANGRVHEFGRPGTLLGVLARPELHDVQRLLRPGDNLIMFSDGVTEARAGRTGDLYGEERLRSLVARLGDLTAAATADAIRSAMMTFSGGRLSDDIVALVLKVPA
jgi:sigma-B regulation protein RsbU (phosphoserine phosphatase)